MFGFGKKAPGLHCSECGGRMAYHVGGRCSSSVWDAVKEALMASGVRTGEDDKRTAAQAKQKAARADADLKYMAEVAERAAIAKEANRQVRDPYRMYDDELCRVCGIRHRKALPCPPPEVLAQLKEKAAKAAEVPHWYTAPEHPQAKAPELPPRKLYGGELLNDLHKRVVALEDKAAVKDVGFAAGRRAAFDEVEAVVRNSLDSPAKDVRVRIALTNILELIGTMRAK